MNIFKVSLFAVLSLHTEDTHVHSYHAVESFARPSLSHLRLNEPTSATLRMARAGRLSRGRVTFKGT